MHCNSFLLTYRGYTIWIRTTGCVSGAETAWSAAYQLCLHNVALHQYVDAAGLQRSAKAAAARAERFAKIDIDRRMESSTPSAPGQRAFAPGKVSHSWLLRLNESRQRKS